MCIYIVIFFIYMDKSEVHFYLLHTWGLFYFLLLKCMYVYINTKSLLYPHVFIRWRDMCLPIRASLSHLVFFFQFSFSF